MGVNEEANAELAAYQHKDVAQRTERLRDEMSTFVTGVSDDFKEECREDMLHGNMDLGRLMVHAQEVEDIRRRKGDRERKKSRSSDQSDSSNNNNSFGVWDMPKFKKRHKHSAEPPKRNKIYALRGGEEHENPADVVTGTLHVFSFPVYALLDPGLTLSFVTPLVASKCDSLPEISHEPLLVSTPIGDSVRAERVYRD
ncbi:uncharacterized protein [Solanum lycopersicum]|uniref:uncharacterized protein n=1 Tax=Solanum lycopersicum TaxID=4081 RepID=UPI00374A8215